MPLFYHKFRKIKYLFFRIIPGIILSIIFRPDTYAQVAGLENQKQYQVHIHKAATPVKLDGELDDAVWQNAEKARGFINWQPSDVGNPKRQTEFMLTYNNQHLYVGIKLFDTSFYVIKTLKRDAEVGESDVIGINFDPTNQHTNGYTFIVNAFNVQAEDVITGGGVNDIDFSWDNKWVSAVARHNDFWSCEMAIPFKTLRYPAGNKVWGVNIGRGDLKNNEYSIWAKLPAPKMFTDLGFTGQLIWDEPPPDVGTTISFIPYGKASLTEDKQGNAPWKAKADAGFDVKATVFKTMSLDATVNPDFSQVDVDEQVTNLTRFSIFFPEKRTFFLENADLFTEYGAPPVRPFYSRTIGLDPNGNAIPILGGARLSGNVTDKLRIGLMNIQTQRKGDFAAQNYTAFSVNQRVLKRSVIKAYYLNRQGFLNHQEKLANPLDAFGRNTGLQLNYDDEKGLWSFQGGYHLSMKPGISNKNFYRQLAGGYTGRKFSFFNAWEDVAINYYTDMGYVERIYNYDAINDSVFRLGFKQLYNSEKYVIYPAKGNIATHTFALDNIFIFSSSARFIERNNSLEYKIDFKNTAFIEGTINSQAQHLQYGVKFADDANAKPLPAANYTFNNAGVEFSTDKRKLFNVLGGVTMGQFYNGNIQQYKSGVNFRRQPWGNFSLNVEYNKLRFPENYGEANLFLIASRVEICFSTSIFWTTFIQYNTQFNNVNINSRFQWRFKPMSDIYLVYSDNYFTNPLFKNKSRGVILKMNWWLNL